MTGDLINNKSQSLSIIIPLLNEAKALPFLLEQLKIFMNKGVEIILVDGGSCDDTVSLAQSAGFTVIFSDRGRAMQMNAGVQQASGNVFLFLHADTLLPHNADDLIQYAIVNKKIAWGRFDVELNNPGFIFKVIGFFINNRSALSGIATGDQAIFLTRAAWNKVGGFPVQPLMEDVEISKRLKKIVKPIRIKKRVITSARRWHKNGVLKTILLMWYLRWLYWLGVPSKKLAEYY